MIAFESLQDLLKSIAYEYKGVPIYFNSPRIMETEASIRITGRAGGYALQVQFFYPVTLMKTIPLLEHTLKQLELTIDNHWSSYETHGSGD